MLRHTTYALRRGILLCCSALALPAQQDRIETTLSQVEAHVTDKHGREPEQPRRPAPVRVVNRYGSITLELRATDRIKAHTTSSVRRVRKTDLRITQQPDVFLVETRPDDQAQVDLSLELPAGLVLEAETVDGDISITGAVRGAYLLTETGSIRVAVPLDITEIDIGAQHEPADLFLPPGASLRKQNKPEEPLPWRVRDEHDRNTVIFGKVEAKARSPKQIIVNDLQLRREYPVQIPWHAPKILDSLAPDIGVGNEPAAPPTEPTESIGNEATFRSDVRMVNLLVSVRGRKDSYLPGLKPVDFEVVENEQIQQVASVDAEETPFNLALLLDLSESTLNDREAMKEIARNFVGIARPQDRVAVYALADNFFEVISELTTDKEALQARIEGLPALRGSSPLYDCLVHAYVHKLHLREGERNALLVITDGIDNRWHHRGRSKPGEFVPLGLLPSQVSRNGIRRLAGMMNGVLYPILFPPSPNRWEDEPWAVEGILQQAWERMAKPSGGRVFLVESIQKMEPVYAQVADELRSVYRIAYYPKNQNFDGSWRRISVSVKKKGAVVRTREGYQAR